MGIDRRAFIKGTIAAGAVAALVPILPALPRIVGDGMHNDWPGLQAALDGKPFIDVNGLVRVVCDGDEKKMQLGAGVFRMSETLRNRSGMSICGAIDKSELGPQSTLVLDVDDELHELLRIDQPYPREISNLMLRRADRDDWWTQVHQWKRAHAPNISVMSNFGGDVEIAREIA